jgi:hypothetical protein
MKEIEHNGLLYTLRRCIVNTGLNVSAAVIGVTGSGTALSSCLREESCSG